ITERRHAPVLADRADRVEIVALSDLSAERMALIGDMVGVPRAHHYQDFQEMLGREALDLVHICTPHHIHEEQAVAAMQAGAHVLLEKPIATDVDQVDRMIAASRATGKRLTVSHNQIFSPTSQAAKRLVQGGEIGDPFLVRLEGFGGYRVVGRGMDPAWRADPSVSGGGPFIDSGFHSVYKAVDWIGSPVARAYARIGTYVADIATEDMAVVLLEHENGATTSIQIGFCAPGGAVGMQEIFCTKGHIRLAYGRENPLSVWRNASGAWDTPAVESEPPDRLGFPQLVDLFLTAIESGGPVPVTAESSRHILAAVRAAYESGRTGRVVDVA
ncbi:MAG: Gfo/Idh/MocA family oxidoreductase, partial [Anaerolineae bacterium]|nr:Gfo/Idh/MocA family oxidoreductase [Anaerolineae bacterium]